MGKQAGRDLDSFAWVADSGAVDLSYVSLRLVALLREGNEEQSKDGWARVICARRNSPLLDGEHFLPVIFVTT